MSYHAGEVRRLREFLHKNRIKAKEITSDHRRVVRAWVRERHTQKQADSAGSREEQFAYFHEFYRLSKADGWMSLATYALAQWAKKTQNLYGAIYSAGWKQGHDTADHLTRNRMKQIGVDRRSTLAKKAAEALHDKPGGTRAKANEIRKLWATGKFANRDECAEQECAALEMSFSAARMALRNTPDPHRQEPQVGKVEKQ